MSAQRHFKGFPEKFITFEAHSAKGYGVMKIRISGWLNKRYPQNLLIRRPLLGALIFLVFCICFVFIYKPLQLHESRFFSYGMTVAIYFIIMTFPLYGVIKLIRRCRYFSDPEEWTILKEMLSILIALAGVGVTVYFAGFMLEIPDNRWNLSTFFDSAFTAFLIGIVPFTIFTLTNYRYLFVSDIIKNYNTSLNQVTPLKSEELIRIVSQLKKEELEFYPDQFIYAEADGNYIVFYLDIENQIRKKTIRNSISNIEQQLSVLPSVFRTHRAFIVNITKVSSQKGNTLGYRLKLSGIDAEIPVSRQKSKEFDQILKQYH